MSDYKDDRTAPVTIAKDDLPHIMSCDGPAYCAVKDGIVTMIAPLPEAYPKARILLDADAVHQGSLAGYYEVQFTSPTQGVIGALIYPLVIDTTKD